MPSGGRGQQRAGRQRIYQARNRIAHHEPVYGHRLYETLEAIEFVVTRLGQREASRATPLAQLLADEWQALSIQSDDLRGCIEAMTGRSAEHRSGERLLEELLVPRAGLEPARLAAGDFESPASTCFTTWAGVGEMSAER